MGPGAVRAQATHGPPPKPRWRPLPQPFTRRWSRRFGADAVWSTCDTGACRARWRRSSRCWRPAVGRSIRHLSNGSISVCGSGWRQSGGTALRRVRAKRGLGQHLALFQRYHNFVLPHASLRQVRPESVATHGSGSAKVWRPCTIAMAAGLTDHVWRLKRSAPVSGCRRGHSHKQSKKPARVDDRIVGGLQGCSEAGQEARAEGVKTCSECA